MKLEILLLVYCFCAIESKKSDTANSAENEVLDKGDVVMKFPSYLYQIPEETIKKNFRQRKFKGRTITTNVEPMEGM